MDPLFDLWIRRIVNTVVSCFNHSGHRYLCCPLDWLGRECGTRNTPSASLWLMGKEGKRAQLMLRRRTTEHGGMQKYQSFLSNSTCLAAQEERKRTGSSTSCLPPGLRPARAERRAQVKRGYFLSFLECDVLFPSDGTRVFPLIFRVLLWWRCCQRKHRRGSR